ncbi:MAG: UDP-4-amino-4,6-dideoxy-N-acetyl-beta-L-altrosamine transaminase [Planctomycetota bacterium]
MIPYGRQSIDEEDIQAVAEVLSSDWLTTGPKVAEFERVFADFVGSKEAVAVCNGTAALHAAMFSLEIGPGDEVIVPPMTFASTANCILFQGGTPVFADIDPNTLLIDPTQVEASVTSRTRAIIAVDYTGQPCEYDELQTIANERGLALVADACHSLGGRYKARPVGSLADLSVFSFHPVKHITTGEGGMVTTDDSHLAERMRIFRNHGITDDHHQRIARGSWYYEMVALGYNYRLTDFQCALGMAQLTKLPAWIGRRREIATHYSEGFASMPEIQLPVVHSDREPAWHLYVIRLKLEGLRVGREEIFRRLRGENIGVNVHYIPVPWHPYYQNLGYVKGQWPVAEEAYERIISLPMFSTMTDQDVEQVIGSLKRFIGLYRV